VNRDSKTSLRAMASPLVTILVFLMTILATYNAQFCGRVKVASSFSIGSEYAVKGQWPWLVPLLNVTGSFFCGSTIVSEKYLITGKQRRKM
jgi:secreted trypsin-like serine protease